jgi:hypothetical protein
MRDWIRARLDAYEGRYEQRDEEFAGLVSHHVNALSNRRTLKIYILILSSVNALIWLSVIVLPADVAAGWTIATGVNDRLGAVVIAIIFGIGMWLSYSLFRLKYPDLEDPKFENEIFASQKYSDHSVKRWCVWLFSVIGGVLNVLLLSLTEAYLVAGW